MADLTWYRAANISPGEREYVLVYDNGAHYIANCISEQWYDDTNGEELVFSPDAWWTDLPRP